MTVASVLRAALALLTKGWDPHFCHRPAPGGARWICDWSHPAASIFAVEGAILRAAGGPTATACSALDMLNEAVGAPRVCSDGGGALVISWAQAPGRTKAEVLDLVARVAIRAGRKPREEGRPAA